MTDPTPRESSPLAERIRALALGDGLSGGMVYQAGEQSETFRPTDLWAAVERVSRRLVQMGITKGDRIAWLSLNHPAQLVTLIACARIGAIWVPLNFRLAVPELQQVIDDAAPSALVFDTAHQATALALRASQLIHLSVEAWMCEPSVSPQACATSQSEPSGGHGEDPVLLVYTSGTTGRPKGAVHTQDALLNNARASVWAHDLHESDVVLSTLPMFHVGGLCIQTLPAWLHGARVILHARFDPGQWIASVEQHRPSLSLLVPATLRAVMEHPRWAQADFTSLRGIMTGSSVVPQAYIEAFHQRGIPVGQVYGTTETGPVSVALRLSEARDKVGSSGQPHSGAKLRLIDDHGKSVPQGGVGEISLCANNLMWGYWNAEQRPGDGLTDGWFHTGDLGHLDAEGHLRVVGRNKDMIISGGENIYPAEIENLLVTFAGVAECAVVGLPDAQWGEVPVLVVVKSNGPSGAELSAPAIQAHLAAQLAKYKWPKQITFVHSLPKSALGKVLKPQLREQLLTSLNRASA